jgi:hypothetical protein
MVVDVNPLTGSVIMTGIAIDQKKVMAFAEEEKLFTAVQPELTSKTLPQTAAAPLAGFSDMIRQFSNGMLDLPGAIFLSLLAYGIVELARGNFSRPPWYTALWYAFGLFSKSLIDQSNSTTSDPK